MSATIIEFLGRADQTDIAFLDQVQEGNAAPHVLLGNRNDQTRVGCDQVLTGGPTIFDQAAQFSTTAQADFAFCQFLTRHASTFDALCQFHFFLSGEQRHTTDLFKVQPNGIVRIDIGKIIFKSERFIFFCFGFSLFGGQFIFAWLAGSDILHKGNASAQKSRKRLFQLLNILLGLREEMQYIIQCDIRFLTT